MGSVIQKQEEGPERRESKYEGPVQLRAWHVEHIKEARVAGPGKWGQSRGQLRLAGWVGPELEPCQPHGGGRFYFNCSGKPLKAFKQVKTGSDLPRGDTRSISKSWNFIASIKILRSVSVLSISQEIQVFFLKIAINYQTICPHAVSFSDLAVKYSSP